MLDLRGKVRRLTTVLRYSLKLALTPDQRKHLVSWLLSLRENYLLDTPSPWISFDAIDYVDAYLRRKGGGSNRLRVFEYGSGGSTLYWQHHGLECTSIEHDPRWFDFVHGRITSPRVEHRLVLPEAGAVTVDADVSDPAKYASSAEEFQGYSFRKYVETIDAFPANSFDLVLVDGRARPSCIVHAAGKVKSGGLLVVDNAEREYYMRQTRPVLADFQTHEFWGALPLNPFFTRTDVHVRR